jgi:hypothetical protein
MRRCWWRPYAKHLTSKHHFEIQKRKNTHTYFICLCNYLSSEKGALKDKGIISCYFSMSVEAIFKKKRNDWLKNNMSEIFVQKKKKKLETLYWNKNFIILLFIFYLHLLTSRDSIFYFIYQIIGNNDLCYWA